MKRVLVMTAACLGLSGLAFAAEEPGFRPLGGFIVKSRMKLVAGKLVEVPVKPLKLLLSTDGVYVRMTTPSSGEDAATFRIYRADGVGTRREGGGPLEVLPGVQATSDGGGVHQHLRLTREGLTLTTFPGISDQTVITTAVAEPAENMPPAEKRPAAATP